MADRSVHGARGFPRRPSAGLLVAVVAWWSAIGGATLLMMPLPAVSAPPTPFAVTAGHPARIRQPGIAAWPIPVEREAFEEAQRGFRESDEAAIEHAGTAFEWIRVEHGEAVTIVAVDGEAIQVELLGGPNVGRRAWLKSRHLGP